MILFFLFTLLDYLDPTYYTKEDQKLGNDMSLEKNTTKDFSAKMPADIDLTDIVSTDTLSIPKDRETPLVDEQVNNFWGARFVEKIVESRLMKKILNSSVINSIDTSWNTSWKMIMKIL